MAYARPYGQAQGASPWSSGVPPGLQQQQQQQQAQQVQPMFNQPMGAFDISGAWQGQPQAAQQWVQPMQQVQFVPNPAYMQQQPQMRQQQQHQQQRPMHQRSLSAPRIGANGFKRPMNMNQNSFGGPQQHLHRSQQSNQYQQRVTRQQSRMNQKGHNNNHSNHSNHSNNTNNNNNKQQNQHQHQQQQQKQQQSTKQVPRKGSAKVTKVKKQVALRTKQNSKAVSVGNKVEKASTTTNVATDDVTTAKASADSNQPAKGQSKTAERKQLKLQARKNAEALKQNKLPVAKVTKVAGAEGGANADQKVDEPIEQAQLKCVPAVFGFVCKLCDVFLRDKLARREHIDSDEHIEKFKVFEEGEKVKQEEIETETKVEAPAPVPETE